MYIFTFFTIHINKGKKEAALNFLTHQLQRFSSSNIYKNCFYMSTWKTICQLKHMTSLFLFTLSERLSVSQSFLWTVFMRDFFFFFKKGNRKDNTVQWKASDDENSWLLIHFTCSSSWYIFTVQQVYVTQKPKIDFTT